MWMLNLAHLTKEWKPMGSNVQCHLPVSTLAHLFPLFHQSLGLSLRRGTFSGLRRIRWTRPVCASSLAPPPLSSWHDCSRTGCGTSGSGLHAWNPELVSGRSETRPGAGLLLVQRPVHSYCPHSGTNSHWLSESTVQVAWGPTHTAHKQTDGQTLYAHVLFLGRV